MIVRKLLLSIILLALASVAKTASFTQSPTGTITDNSYVLSWSVSNNAISWYVNEYRGGVLIGQVARNSAKSVSLSGKQNGSYRYELVVRERGEHVPGEPDIFTSIKASVQFVVNKNVYAPTGSVNQYALGQTTISGNASDPDSIGEKVNVHLWVDGVQKTWAWTSTSGAYALNVPSNYVSDNNNHTFLVKAKDLQTGQWHDIGTTSIDAVPPPQKPSSLNGPNSVNVGNPIGLSWTSVAAANKYQLYENNFLIYDGVDRSINLSKRAVGTYSYKVHACSDISGCSVLAATKTVGVVNLPPPIPATPSSLTVPTAPQGINGSYSITWSSVPHASNYKLYEKEGEGSWSNIYSGSNSSFQVSGRAKGSYSYQLKACSTSGCSALHIADTSVTVDTVGSDTYFLSYPLTTITDGAYGLQWLNLQPTNPSIPSESQVIAYYVKEVKDGVTSQIGTNGQANSKDFVGMRSGDYEYEYHIAKRYKSTNDGEGGWTLPEVKKWHSITVEVRNPIEPPILNYTGTTLEPNYSITWSQESGATRYSLEERKNGGDWVAAVSNQNILAKSFVDKSGALYEYRVKACSDSVCSGYSQSVLAPVLESGDITANQRTVLSTSTSTDVAACVSLNTIPTGANSVKVQRLDRSSSQWIDFTSLVEIENQKVCLGTVDLTRDYNSSNGKSEKTFRLAACLGQACRSEFSQPITVEVQRASFVEGLPYSRGDYELRVTEWRTPSLVIFFDDGGSPEEIIQRDQQTLPFIYSKSGISQGSHKMSAKQCNSVEGTSSQSGQVLAGSCVSNVASKWVYFEVKYLPGVPRNLAATVDAQNGDVTVNWLAPSVTAQTAAADDYLVELLDSAGNNIGNYERDHHSSLSHVFNSVANGNYRVRVSACNQVGTYTQSRACGPATEISVQVQASSVPAPSAPTLNLDSTSNTGQYSVSWNTVANGASYQLESKFGGDWELVAEVSGTSLTVNEEKTENGTYSYRVKACNSDSLCGDYSPSKSIVVDIVSPIGLVAVKGLGHEETDNGFDISWDLQQSASFYRVTNVTGSWITHLSDLAAEAEAEAEAQNEQAQGDTNTGPSFGPRPPGDSSASGEDEEAEPFNYLDLIAEGEVNVDTPPWSALEEEGFAKHKAYYFLVQACRGDKESADAACGPVEEVYPVVYGNQPWAAKGDKQVPDAEFQDLALPLGGHDAKVGAVPGSGSVSGGQANYQVPITVVPGRNGMQPSVSVSYSSRSGNSILGMGWSVSAGSSISRCPKIVAIDGVNGGIGFNSDDRLCLDGQRLLVSNNKAYGSADAEYRLQMDNFTLVKQSGGDLESESARFDVYYKNGRHHRYGYDTQSSVPDNISISRFSARHKPAGINQVLSWHISLAKDPSGNNIQYFYSTESSGQHLIKGIYYTGHAGSLGNRKVLFEYEGAARPDISSRYIAGGLIRQTKRLAKIITKKDNQQARSYNFSFSLSEATERSLLSEVKECAYGSEDGEEICRRPTSFDWLDQKACFELERVAFRNADAVAHENVQQVLGDGPDSNSTEMYPVTNEQFFHQISKVIPRGDMNGDGVRDWPGLVSSDNSTLIQKTRSLDAEGKLVAESDNVLDSCFYDRGSRKQVCVNADFNVDGKTDTWKLDENNLLQILYSGAASYIPTEVKLNDTYAGSKISSTADFNGDGWPDIMTTNGFLGGDSSLSGIRLRVWLHTKNIAAPYIERKSSEIQIQGVTFDGKVAKGNSISVMGDVTGNGLPDLLVSYTDSETGAHIPSFIVRNTTSKTGNARFASSDNERIDLPDMGVVSTGLSFFSQFMDVNGDGLQDIFGWRYDHIEDGNAPPLHLSINMGNGKFTPYREVGGNKNAIGNQYKWYRQVRDQSNESYRVATREHAMRQVDLDSDGRAELMFALNPLVEMCVRFKNGAGPLSGIVKQCGTSIGNGYKTYTTLGPNPGFSHRNPAFDDDQVYTYASLSFKENPNGTWDAVVKDTGLSANANHSAAVDAFGNGLTDIVFSVGCEARGNVAGVSGEDVCEITSRPDALEEDGVYVWRNRGSVRSGSDERYQPVDMLVSATNGLGVKDEWVYRPLSSRDGRFGSQSKPFYKPDFDYIETLDDEQAKDKHFHFSSSMYVVAKHSQSNGLADGMNDVNYRYKGAIYNSEGRGFQGFTRVYREDKAAKILSVSDFFQVFPLAGKLFRSGQWPNDEISADNQLDFDGSLEQGKVPFSQTQHSWRLIQKSSADYLVDENSLSPVSSPARLTAANDAGIYFVAPYKTQTTRRSLSPSRSILYQQVNENEYDLWGNVDKSIKTYAEGADVNQNVSISISENTYNYSKSQDWWLNRLESNTLTRNGIQARTGVANAANLPAHYDNAETVVTRYGYHSTHRKPNVVTLAPVGVAAGNVTRTDYNVYGLPKKVGVRVGSQNRETTTTYDSENYFPHRITNPTGQATGFTYNALYGAVSEIRQPTGLTVQTDFDAFGYPYLQRPDDRYAPDQYTIKRWCDNNLDNASDPLDVGSCPANAKVIVMQAQVGTPDKVTFLDKLGRDLGNNVKGFDGRWTTIRKNYDALGRLEFESVPKFSSVSIKGVHYQEYDLLGRLTLKRTDQGSGASLLTRYTHEQGIGFTTDILLRASGGNAVTDHPELSMSRTYNGLQQLLKTTDAKGGTTEYAYDGQGNPIVIRDANGHDILASYDALGRKQFVIDPNMGRKDFVYNGYGEVASESDARGYQLHYSYDDSGRMRDRHITNPEGTYWKQAEWEYGYRGLLLTEATFLPSEITADNKKSYNYDLFGRPISVDTSIDSQVYTTGMEYDGRYGRVKAVAYPNQLRLAYEYNDTGYQNKVLNANSGYVYSQLGSMSEWGHWTSASKADNAFTETQTIDAVTGWLKSINASALGQKLHEEVYTQDAYGNLVSTNTQVWNEIIPNAFLPNDLSNTRSYTRVHTFSYDSLHRLETFKEEGSGLPVLGGVSYSYDAAGNMTKKSDYASVYNYASGSNRLSSVQLATNNTIKAFQYDAGGNLIGESINSSNRGRMQYNAFNKPYSISRTKNQETSTVTINYGADLMRYRKVDNKGVNYYVGKQYEQTIKDGVRTHRYYLEGIAVLTETESSDGNGGADFEQKIGFTHKDRLGSTTAVLDHEGKLRETRSFDPFGKPLANVDINRPSSLLDSAFSTRGFTDHEHLDSVEIIHMNGRGYDYNLGRFLSVDPFIVDPGNSQAINPYSYIMNNPLSGTDPTGYAACTGSRLTCDKLPGQDWGMLSVTATVGDNGDVGVEIKGGTSHQQQRVADAIAGHAAGLMNLGQRSNVQIATFDFSGRLGGGASGDEDEPGFFSRLGTAFVSIFGRSGLNGIEQAKNQPSVDGASFPKVTKEEAELYTQFTGAALAGGTTGTIAGMTHAALKKESVRLIRTRFAKENSVWSMKPTDRGNAIESALAKTDYKDWFNVGKLNRGYFPLVDFQKGNILVSLKTVDTRGLTWMGRMTSHIDDLATRRATVSGQRANMVLDLRVQPGGARGAASLIQYGRQRGVNVMLKEY